MRRVDMHGIGSSDQRGSRAILIAAITVCQFGHDLLRVVGSGGILQQSPFGAYTGIGIEKNLHLGSWETQPCRCRGLP